MPSRTTQRLTLLGGCLLGAALLPVAAQEPGDDQKAQPPKEVAIPFWETRQGVKVSSALALLANQNPYTVILGRVAGSEQALLEPEWQLVSDKAPPLSRKWLDQIQDRTPIPDFRPGARHPITPADWAFYWALCEALGAARQTPVENFRRSAQENEGVDFTNLFANPDRYRGEVIPLHGRLLMVRRWDAPKAAQQNGVKVIYEGWIKGPLKRSNPFCVICTDLPDGIPLGKDIDIPVTFYGYFLKKFRYTGADADRLTNYLVGPTVVLEKTPRPIEPSQPFSRVVLFAVAGGVLALTILAFGLTWWFRRGDARIQSRLAELRDRHGPPEPPAPDPVPQALPVPPQGLPNPERQHNGPGPQPPEPRPGGPA